MRRRLQGADEQPETSIYTALPHLHYASRLGGLRKSRANRAKPDVGEHNSSIRRMGLHILGLTRRSRALATHTARLLRARVGRIRRVEPEHVGRMVVPERHDQDVAASKRRTQRTKPTQRLERRLVAKNALLLLTKPIRDGVSSRAGNGRVRVWKHLTVLHVEALNLAELGARAHELRYHRHHLVRVERCAGPVEVAHTHAVAIEVAAVLVAHSAVAVTAIAARRARAFLKPGALARMRRVGSGDGVGFPNVHFRAARPDFAGPGVGVRGRRVPAADIGFAVNELDVVGTLGVAVSSPVFGAGLIVAFAEPTVRGHFYKVQGTVESAGKLGHVNVKGEFLADDIEQLVIGVVFHEVGTRADVVRLALGDKLEAQSIVAGGDSVGPCSLLVEVPIAKPYSPTLPA